MPEKPRPVKVLRVLPTDVADIIAQTGEIQPHTETDLGFRVNGRIVSRTADVGARVSAGETIAVLDSSDIANEVRAAEADLESASAAETAARSTLDRQRSLFDKQVVAKPALETADAEWRSAASRREAAEANLENARNKLGYTKLVAVDAGVVTAIGANAGQVVGAGQMVVRVASDGAKDAVFNVSERLISGASEDIPVRVALTSDPAVNVLGSVREISPAADPVTRTYRVRVALPGAPKAMTLGATVSGTVEIPGGKVMVVPALAITSRSSSPAVFVVDTATSKLALKSVVVARYTDTSAVIQSGLAVGDEVVVAGVSKLRPDQAVKLEEAGQ
ncbi:MULTISPECIES: efflux RND transporter periplasmic adaptor subunit [unclassified Mesorhizobium]|uniref:efflux RND transporter periplasmic adaptor subunit n=1 Tax=unclassified Mesorhizobium TaxID=325217 RepID=UPI001AEDE34F|nr:MULTISPECIES: efflux RND transporter periplasmic adaptor subunit [unclassified Mesorhizobium]